jgi:DNA invertase Pin-like site-specific DNA recombinase
MFFTDDGYSGTDFNRPDFQRMEAMVERGEIGTIIVKDLSRFARNYIEAGNYIEG